MGRCSGCSGDRCSCVIRAGAGTRVTGAGTQANPYVIEADGGSGGGGGRLPGEIIAYGGSVAPAGWLVANGQAVARAAYSALFTAIGIAYGAGDGSTTFNLPDLAGNFPLGADSGHPLGSAGGAEQRTLTDVNLPPHQHGMAHTHDISHGHTASASIANTDHAHSGSTSGVGDHVHTIPAHTHPGLVVAGNALEWKANAFAAGNAPGLSGSGEQAATVRAEPAFFSVGAGAHSHSVSTNTQSATGYGNYQHTHGITVNAFSGSSGAAAPNTTGQGPGTSQPFSTMPPYVAVTYLIKT